MISYKSDFLTCLKERGFIHQCTDIEALDHRLYQGRRIAAYIGFDATADSLHVGSLLPIMLLRILQKKGHKPIVLIGGGTTKIGDPSGKDTERQLLETKKIQENAKGIKNILAKYIRFGNGDNDAILLDNSQWLDHLNYLDFLRDYGRHFTINRMLSFESVKRRLEREQPLSFLEFNYMILQGYDFLHLYDKYDCVLQMGGTDQWGNIINGVELIRRVKQGQAYGLTAPLITTSSGAKMGKTAQGAIWLSTDHLSSFDFWQYWRNTDDRDVGRFLKLFTDLPMDKIQQLATVTGNEINESKKILADEVTRLTHGEQAVVEARETAEKLFEAKSIEGTLMGLPEISVSQKTLDQGISLIQLLCQAYLATSKGEAKRLIRGGGARLNDLPVTDEAYTVTSNDLSSLHMLKLSAGKKRHAVVKVVNFSDEDGD